MIETKEAYNAPKHCQLHLIEQQQLYALDLGREQREDKVEKTVPCDRRSSVDDENQ
jgi:hypothetical protein